MAQTHSAADATGPAPQVYYYRAYGLRIASDFVLGELEEVEAGTCDLEVRFAPVERRGPTQGEGSHFDFSGPEIYFGWPGFARFLLRSPALIEVELEPDGPATLLALPLLGPIIAVLLYRRGYVVLHGSAVAMAGDGVMFLGDKEAGKSTTAAAMLAAGCDLVSDDVVAVDLTSRPPTMLTAYPSLKLTETASAYYSPDGAALLDRPFDDFPKDRFRLGQAFRGEDTPVRFAFLLERTGADPSAETLRGQDALSAILRFSYMVRFGGEFLNGQEAGRHFKQCASLSRAIGVCRLRVPDRLERVNEVPPFIATTLQSAE